MRPKSSSTLRPKLAPTPALVSERVSSSLFFKFGHSHRHFKFSPCRHRRTGMTLGSVDLDILGPFGEYCLIRNLDTFGDTFSSGATDLFTGDDLQGCYEYLFVDYNVTEVLVQHSGTDAWQCENMKLYFDDGVYVQCDYGDFLDNESVPLTCERAN